MTLPISLFVFDLDGTLVDSKRDIAESVNAVLEECGAVPLSEEAIAGMVGEGAALLIARAFAAANCPKPPDLLERFLRAYERRLVGFTRPYEGVTELLETLVSRGHIMGVLTNKPLAATRAILAGLDLAAYFGDRVVGGDGPWPRKPDPGGLEHLMEQAAVSRASTLMVGDSVVDLRTARGAGVQICMARYGFGFAGFPTGEISGSDRMIDRPLDLLSTL